MTGNSVYAHNHSGNIVQAHTVNGGVHLHFPRAVHAGPIAVTVKMKTDRSERPVFDSDLLSQAYSRAAESYLDAAILSAR